MQRQNLNFVLAIAAGAMLAAMSPARALQITSDLELITIPAVGQAYKSVAFENSYTAPPVAICTGTTGLFPIHSPIVRLNNVTTTGMQLRTQSLSNDSYNTTNTPVNVGDVHCLIAKEGVHKWPNDPDSDKNWMEVGRVNVTRTFGHTNNGVGPADEWNQAVFEDGQIFVSQGLNGDFLGSPLQSQLGVLAQIMTDNDPLGQAPFVTDCDALGSNPYQSGFTDGACLGRHVGRLAWTTVGGDNMSRAPEEMGYIVFRRGFDIIVTEKGAFRAISQISADTIEGTRANRNSPPYTSSLEGYRPRAGVVTMQGMDGADGGFATLYGSDPFAGNEIDLSVEEAVTADRRHTTEFVAYMAFQKIGERIEAAKKVDIVETDEQKLLTYNVEVKNPNTIDFLNVTVEDVLDKDGDLSDFLPNLTFSESISNDGVLNAGEIWSYQGTYQITEQDLIDYEYIDNVYAISSDPVFDAGNEITRLGAAGEIVFATTLLKKNPDVSVVKTSRLLDGSTIPPEGVKVGDVIEYTYTISNTGNQILAPVEISDNHQGKGAALDFVGCVIDTDDNNRHTQLGTTDFSVASLGPSDIVKCTATYVVTQQDINELQ